MPGLKEMICRLYLVCIKSEEAQTSRAWARKMPFANTRPLGLFKDTQVFFLVLSKMTLFRQGTIIRQRILFHMLNLFIGKQKNAYHLQKGKVTSFIIYEALSWLKFIFIGLDVRSWCFIMFPKSRSAF